MNPYMLQMRHTPAILERTLDQIPSDRFQEPLQDGRFNLVEMVAHIADCEDIFLDRMRLAVEKPGANITPFDPETRALEKRYAERDIRHELQVFANRRRDTVDFLESISPEQAKLSVKHPQFGEMSVNEIATFLLGHDIYHLEQASEYLATLHELVP